MKLEEEMIRIAFQTEMALLEKQIQMEFASGNLHPYYDPEIILKKYLKHITAITPLGRAMSED